MVISHSVGRGGSNIRTDVCLVQMMLNEWRRCKNMQVLAVDGIVGPRTISAIEEFQRSEVSIVDGRVDQNGPSIRKLVPIYNGLVVSFITRNCRELFRNFETQLLTTGKSFPISLQLRYSAIRQDIDNLNSLNYTSVATRHATDVSPVAFIGRPPVFALVGVDDLTFLILALFVLLFAMAIIIAKPALEELVKRLIILMSKIKDLVDELIEKVKQAAQSNLKQFQQCKPLFDQIIALAAEILAEIEILKTLKPADEFTRERLIRQLADKMQRLQDLTEQFFACMGTGPVAS